MDKKTILVVDDEPELAEALAYFIRSAGYEAVLASSGRQAMQIVAERKIDLVVSDIRMPEGDGIELLEFLTKQNPPIPRIILISGYSDYTRESIMEKGAIGYFDKPFRPKEVVALIQKSLSSEKE